MQIDAALYDRQAEARAGAVSVRSSSTSAFLRSVMSIPKPRMCGSWSISIMSAETSNVPTLPRRVRAWHSTSCTEPLLLKFAQNFARSSGFSHVSSFGLSSRIVHTISFAFFVSIEPTVANDRKFCSAAQWNDQLCITQNHAQPPGRADHE